MHVHVSTQVGQLTHADPTAHAEVTACLCVCREAAACRELCYVTYGPNMEHVSANMQTEQFAAMRACFLLIR